MRRVEENVTERAAVAASEAPRAAEPLGSGRGGPVAGSGRGDAAGLRLGRYEILFELARGGLGTVYVGRLVGAHGFDRLVAIKRLTAAANEEDTAAFLSEARLAARINHPSVVQTLELGEHGGDPFIVMQLVQGVSLAQLLRRLSDTGEALAPDLAAWIVAQAATGLHAAHELTGPDERLLGIVHRDVSPQNLLLSFEGRVYVADFGVAKFAGADRSTQSGVVKGKFAYMSPEQTRAAPIDRRSDVFALGIVLYESLTGRRLFAGSSPADTIRRVIEERAPSPRDHRPEVPDVLVPIVARCLAKDPGDRYGTAAELADVLRGTLRQRRAVVDEGDLAELIGERFRGERGRLRDRIRESVAASPGEPRSDEARPEGGAIEGADRALETPSARGAGPGRRAAEEASERRAVDAEGSVSATIGPARGARQRRLGGGIAALLVIVGAAGAWWALRNPAPDGVAAATANTTAGSAPSSAPSVAPAAEKPPPPDGPGSSIASAEPGAPSAAPTARAASPAEPRGVKPSSAPKARATAAATAAAAPAASSAAPKAESHGGVPFRSLDP